MKTLRKICGMLSGICCAISAVACVIMMIIVTCDTSGRYFFQRPITGSYDICQYLLSVILFGGYAYCQYKHGFLHVTMFINKFPQKLCCTVWALMSLFSAAVGVLLAYLCYQHSIYVKSNGAESLLLGIPDFPFILFASVAMTILVIDLIVDTIYAIIAIFNKEVADEIVSEWV